MKTPRTPQPRPQADEIDEHFNVRQIHGRLWREWNEPTEKKRRFPWYLQFFYLGMFVWGFSYFTTYAGNLLWDEYEHRIVERAKRDFAKKEAPVIAPTPLPTPQ